MTQTVETSGTEPGGATAGEPFRAPIRDGLSLRRSDERLRAELPLWHAPAVVAISCTKHANGASM
jgi:hypothetical protein